MHFIMSNLRFVQNELLILFYIFAFIQLSFLTSL